MNPTLWQSFLVWSLALARAQAFVGRESARRRRSPSDTHYCRSRCTAAIAASIPVPWTRLASSLDHDPAVAPPLTHRDVVWKIRPHPDQGWRKRLYARSAALLLRTYLKVLAPRSPFPTVMCPAGNLCRIEAWVDGQKVGRFGISTTPGPSVPLLQEQAQLLYTDESLPIGTRMSTAAIQYMFVEPAYRQRQIGALALQVIAFVHAWQVCDFTLLVADDEGSGKLVAWYEDHSYQQAPLLQELLGSPNAQYGVAMMGPTNATLPADCRIQWW